MGSILVQGMSRLVAAVRLMFLIAFNVTASSNIAAYFSFQPEEGLNAADYAHIEVVLHESRAGVLNDLGLADIQTVTVRIWRDELLYQDAMEASLGSRAPGSRGYIVSDREMRILLTDRSTAAREAVHEFVHVASLNLNADFGNNPRWLWEAVAIYLAGEAPRPQTLFLFQGEKCPLLVSLSQPFNQGGSIYDVGYYLMEFIVDNWGRETISTLVKANGNIDDVLGMNADNFEQRWCSHVRSKYKL